MKKEVFLAVLVGFGLGLIITFGIWTANRNLKPSSSTVSQVVTPSPAPDNSTTDTPTPISGTTTLTISSPDQDEILTNTNRLTFAGKTQPGNTVTVTYETGQQVLVADSSGSFSLEITLEGGYNRITATAFDAAGNSAVKDILITYSSTQI